MTVTFSALGNMGRLGNQLFQMAATIGLALRHGDKFMFPAWGYVNDFAVPSGSFGVYRNGPTFNENGFAYKPIPYSAGLNLNGYFQSAKYFADFDAEIRRYFRCRTVVPMMDGVVGVHIRRGDYVRLGEYHTNIFDGNYYERAIAEVSGNKYMIFSDDIEWCKKRFVGDRYIFASGGEISDFGLMASCEHNIIANSSFSWWAAYLNENPGKKVVAPLDWFGPKLRHDTKDLCPSEWVRI